MRLLFITHKSLLVVTCSYPTNRPQPQQNDNGSDGGGDDVVEDAGADREPQQTQQPGADERSDDADDHRPDTTGADTAHQPIGNGPGDTAHNDPD